ncbi:MAG: membrane lipoprotein lipid attachment site-containing protein [Bacteroidales bacterium]|nr:membrane lipoprotein lipid attachment site-containing protein [Bacteroidales bacterium]
MKRIIYILTAALLLVGCKHEAKTTLYEPAGSIGMEELAAIAQDTSHYRALIFTSPYCYGCRQMSESTQKAVEAMDTSLWRIYYLIVEDIVDSAHWEEVVGDMMDMGIPRELIHHCSLPFEDGMYRDVVALFRTAQPIDPRACMQGVPFELVVDTNNYIPVQRAKAKPEDEDYWYVVRDFIYEDWISGYTDFTFDDGSFVVETTPTTTTDDRTIVLNR